MGIDVYMRWPDQTEEEHQAQYTGFSVVSGDVGYLREAYHGGPYATHVLMPEAFSEDDSVLDEDGAVTIPAATLRERLPATLAAVEKRQKDVYDTAADDDHTKAVKQAFVDFVELAERKEAEGKPVRVYASW